MSISEKALSELANSYINNIDPESVNIKYLLTVSGLSKSTIKDLLCEIVDRCDSIIKVPPKKNTPDIRDVLVREYNLTYSIASRLIEYYDITYPEQLSFLADDELKAITGIGKSTLTRIRVKFPYVEQKVNCKRIDKIELLHFPTKVYTSLTDNSIYNTCQLEQAISNEDIVSLGYPLCTIVERGYELYLDGESNINVYRLEYLNILLQSYERNLNSLIRHSDDTLNLHWINNTIYQFVTFAYEINSSEEIAGRITESTPEFGMSRKLLLESLYADSNDNKVIIKHYTKVKQILQSVIKTINEL